MLQNLKAQKLCSFGANAAFSTLNHLTADNIMLDARILVPKSLASDHASHHTQWLLNVKNEF